VRPKGKESGRATFDLPRLPEEVGAPADNATIAAALSIEIDDIGFDRMPVQRWSAGAPYTIVPVTGLDAVGRCRIGTAHWNKAFGFDSHSAAFIVCREASEPGHAFHTRMFAPGAGIAEDPATGSAAAAFAGYLAAHDVYPDGEHILPIEQGYEMGRPSLMELTLKIGAGKLTGASIGGSAVIVSEGTIEA
jgi:trans-2,3-dihydro-3-hydroxyanthranilate isomerase